MQLFNIYWSDRDWEIFRRMAILMAIPFLGIALMVSIGDFEFDGVIYPKSTWMWLSIAFMWGWVISRYYN